MINTRNRYQIGLALRDLFPELVGRCACGCGNDISGRKKKWFSETCRNSAFRKFAIVKGDTSIIREELYLQDKGACRCCGEITKDWEADHILPVSMGGGGCDLSNYQTLCKDCHREKTHKLVQRKTISSQALSIIFIRAFSDFGQPTTLFANASIDKQRFGDIVKSSSWAICK